MSEKQQGVAATYGGITLPSKAAAKAHFRAIRDAYPDGQALAPDHSAQLRDLLARHPEAGAKIGCGVYCFTVKTDTVFGKSRHFVIHRVDGTSTDFSFLACIDGRRNPDKDRLEALRREIDDQVVAFRHEAFAEGVPLSCPITGAPLSLHGSHVDHAPPMTFRTLVGMWLESEFMGLCGVAITPPADNQLVARMTDSAQRASWTDFHRHHAALRILSAEGNQAVARNYAAA
jgi:hypothetical protein